MYIGDSPVSLDAKKDVARNVAGLMGRCLWNRGVNCSRSENYFILPLQHVDRKLGEDRCMCIWWGRSVKRKGRWCVVVYTHGRWASACCARASSQLDGLLPFCRWVEDASPMMKEIYTRANPFVESFAVLVSSCSIQCLYPCVALHQDNSTDAWLSRFSSSFLKIRGSPQFHFKRNETAQSQRFSSIPTQVCYLKKLE
jgi:hypothetical protein